MFWPFRLELKLSQDKSICISFYLPIQIFILTEGLKIEFFQLFWHYQVEKAVWYKLVVNLVYT